MTDETRIELARKLWQIQQGREQHVIIRLSPADRADTLKRSAERFAAKKRVEIRCWTSRRIFHLVRVECST